MGTPLIRPDGSTIDADEADVPILLKAGFKRDTAETNLERNRAAAAEDFYSSTGQKAITALEGINSGLSIGLTDVASRAVYSDEYNADMQARSEYNPITRQVSEIGGGLLGAIPTGGESLAAATPASMLTRGAAQIGARLEGRGAQLFAEGAILGVGGALEHANVTGDPLTIEATIEGAGMGALLNFGAGLLGDKISKVGRSVAEEKVAISKLADEAEQAAKAGKLLKDPPATWNEVYESHTTVQKSTQKLNKRLMAEAEDYAEAISPDGVREHLAGFRTAKNEIQSRIGETQYGTDVAKGQRAATAAERQYTKDVTAAAKYYNSTKKMPRAFDDFQDAINEAAAKMKVTGTKVPAASAFEEALEDAARNAEVFGDRKAFISSVYEQLPAKWKPNTLDDFKKALAEGAQAGKVKLARADLSSAMDPALLERSLTKRGGADFHFVEFNPVGRSAVEHPLAAEFRDYNEQLSRAMKSRVGGYKVDAKRWAKDPSVAADVERSFKELHELRDKLRKYNVEVPDLPKIPVRPAEFVPPGIELSDAAALGKAAGDIEAAIREATAHLKAGDGAAAVAELRAAQARIHSTPGLEDLHLPDLPAPAQPPLDVVPVKMPKSIREFAKMRLDNPKLEALAKAAENNPEFAGALERLANDLGVDPSGGIRAIHKTLNETLAHTEKVAGSLAATAKGEKGWSLIDLLRKRTKVGLASAAGRAADVGGTRGAIGRAIFGGVVGYAADGAEGAMFGATLASAKLGGRSKIRNLVAKLAEGKPAALGKMLRPATAYLGASFIGDEPDDEPDPRKQAVNRINEILRAQYTVRDSMYTTVEPLMGEPGDVAFKIFNQVVGAVQHLASVLPKDPGIDMTPAGSKWTPSHEKTHELAARIEAIKDPMSSLARCIAGRGHYAATETLWACYPAWMQELSSEVAMAAPNLKLTYEEGSMLSKIFRVPMTGLQHQAVVTALQGQYLPKPEQQPGGGGSSPSPNPVGRPAAVQNQVAGSSVAALTA